MWAISQWCPKECDSKLGFEYWKVISDNLGCFCAFQGPQAQSKNDPNQTKADSGQNRAPSSNTESLPRQSSEAEPEGNRAESGEGQKQALHPTSSYQDKTPWDCRVSVAQQPLGESCSNSPRNIVGSTHSKTVNVMNVDGVEHVLLRQPSGTTAHEDGQETGVIACMDSAESGSSISLGWICQVLFRN